MWISCKNSLQNSSCQKKLSKTEITKNLAAFKLIFESLPYLLPPKKCPFSKDLQLFYAGLIRPVFTSKVPLLSM